jgi:chromosome segregation ATPase
MNTRPTPETDKFFATFADGEAAPSHAEYYARLQDLERERDEAREELAAVTEQRDEYKMAFQLAEKYNHKMATELEIVTEQRDEARIELEKYTTDSEDDALYNVRRLRKELATVTEQRDGIDSMCHKIIKEVLECDPIPACKREDDHLEPPWEVIARIREQRDRLAEALQDLLASCNCIDSVDFMPVSMPEAFEKAQQALQSLTLKEL